MRITRNYLKDWLTNKFKDLEIPFVCLDVYRSYNRSHDIEAGACQLIFQIDHIDEKKRDIISRHHLFCFYSMQDLNKAINKDGYVLFINFDRHMSLSADHTSIDIRKKL
jgi:hypothetical protein